MRVFTWAIFGFVAISSVWGLPEEEFHALVRRSIQEADDYLNELEVQQTVNGTQTRLSHKSTPESLQMERAYALHHMAVDNLREKTNATHKEAHRHVRQATNGGGACPRPSANCGNAANSRYRNYDGTCNNINNIWWGAANIAQNRMLAPNYCDGEEPRGCFRSFLPNARDVSAQLHFDRNLIFRDLSNMVHQFGQFLDHDMSITPEAGRSCCNNANQLNCWAIPDNFGRNFGRNCIDFTRSTPCYANGRREQTNMNTAYIDASQVYGSNINRANQLRAFTGGKLITNSQLRGFLPSATQSQQLAANNVQGQFIAGDDRINEMPGLVVLHNLFLIEHNRIADQFRANTNWNDEKIYQETRRIIGAVLQVITYNEYLPAILGDDVMRRKGLYLGGSNTCSNYNRNIDATILNEFSTAAYRFGHTLVSENVALVDPRSRQGMGAYNIGDEYFQAKQFTNGNGQGYDRILSGLVHTQCQYFDPYVVPGLTINLFRNQNQRFGGDLIARNIQRGRDHGLPSYNSYRKLFNLEPLTTNGPPADMDRTAYQELMKVYRNQPDNVDLFSGALHELPSGGASGALFQNMKAEQFRRLKYGDRYFVSHCNSFTAPQRAVLYSRRLSDVMCQSSARQDAPQNAFKTNSPSAACDASRNFDIRPFLNN